MLEFSFLAVLDLVNTSNGLGLDCRSHKIRKFWRRENAHFHARVTIAHRVTMSFVSVYHLNSRENELHKLTLFAHAFYTLFTSLMRKSTQTNKNVGNH